MAIQDVRLVQDCLHFLVYLLAQIVVQQEFCSGYQFHLKYMSRIMRKPIMFPNRPNTNRAVQARMMTRLENFAFRKHRNCTIHVEKTKALISYAVTAICTFVFAFAKCWFSHDMAQMFSFILIVMENL